MVTILRNTPLLNQLIYLVGRIRAKDLLTYFEGQLNSDERILDLGTGMGNVAELLMENGHDVTPLDIQDLSFSKKVKPIIYDGETIPYDEDEFHVVSIMTVLHHTPDPEAIIREAARVGKKVLIIDDIYTSTSHKYLTFFFDSIVNLEFLGHPHSNKSDEEWKEVFDKLGLKISYSHYHTSLLVFRHATYIVEQK